MKYKLLPLYPRYNKIYNSEAELLLNGVQDEEVKNIGIVAHYGAGKSSLLKTFRENNSNKESGLKFLNISLASFNTDSSKKGTSNKKDISNKEEMDPDIESSFSGVQDIDNAVEKSILQQMLYRKEKTDLPKSQIKRNNNFVASRFTLYFFLIITAAICVASFMLYSLNFNDIEILKFKWCDIVYLIMGTVSFISFVVLLIAAISFSKIAFKGIELELKSQNESLLNKFLDEIIYFFQKTKYNVVIFEDLERFDNLNIFSKLRELNSILNSNEVILKNGKITFIYAVKDGMFDNSKDRAKFFDLILPVFGVLSSLNVRSQITNALEESRLGKDWLTKPYIHDISLYIKDMRVLYSIVNDCVTLCSETDLSKLHGDSDVEKHIQIFSLMTYKNLFPKDFAMFEEGNGNFNSLIDKADNLRKQAIKDNLFQISQLEESIKTLKINKNLYRDYKEQLMQSYDELEKLHDKNKKCAGVISYIQDNSETVFNDFKDKNKLIPEYKLLKMLIGYGHIKDSFKNYIYKMDNNFLAENDEKYTYILLDKEEPQFDLKLNNIQIILEDLSADKLLSESALNFDMVNYLFDHYNENLEQLVAFKHLLKQDLPIVAKFIIEYIQVENNWNKRFIKFLVAVKDNLLSIVLDSSISETKTDEFFNHILTENYDISNLSNLDEFVGYILRSEPLLLNIANYANKLSLLKTHGFEIDDLTKINFKDQDIIVIETNNVWKVNHINTCIILNRLYGYNNEEIDKKGITLIKSLKNQHLANYILSDLDDYVANVMLLPASFDIDVNDFKSLIIDEKISIGERKKIINKQITSIDYFGGCPIDIFQWLLEQNKVKATLAQLSKVLQLNINLESSVAVYLKDNYEQFKGTAITARNLILCIVNSGLSIDGKSLTELYINEIKSNLPSIREINNDEAIAIVLKIVAPTLYQDDIKYISDNKFSKSALILVNEYISDILKNNHETNWLAHKCVANNQNNEIRAKIYKGTTLDLSDDDFAVVKPIVNDICKNEFQITDKLYDQITKFKLDEADRKALFLSQFDYWSNERMLHCLKNLGGVYYNLIDKSEIAYDDNLNTDSVILALDSKGVIKKRKKKNRYTIKLTEAYAKLVKAS